MHNEAIISVNIINGFQFAYIPSLCKLVCCVILLKINMNTTLLLQI